LSLGNSPTHFSIAPALTPVAAGAAFQVTVAAVDDQGNVIPGYAGTVHFTSSDNGALLPGDYTFTAADAGVHTFTLTLFQAGSQTFTASDTVSGITGTATIVITAAAADHLLVLAPATVVADMAFDVTVAVQDAFNNTVTYLGTVQFSSSDADPGVLLPPAYTFSSGDGGVHNFAGGVTLITPGSQTLSVEDPSTGIVGEAAIVVTAPAAPGGGAAGRGPGSGRFPSLVGILEPPLPLSGSSVGGTSANAQGNPALPPAALDAASVSALFMAHQAKDQVTIAASEGRGRPARVDIWEDLLGHDVALTPWTTATGEQ
jgi:hypothetical protein